MFDFGSGELLVIGVVALVVIGPKELPGVLRTVGKTVARLRRMAGEFQGQFHDAMREAELHDAVKSLSDIQSSVANVTSYNDPLAGLPIPVLPEPAPLPPVELQTPTTPEAKAVEPKADDAKPARPKKAKAKKPAETDEPQAALFDTLDQMAKTAEAKAEKVAKPVKPKAVKAKAAKPVDEKPAKDKPLKEKSAPKTKRKAKSDEASS